MLFIPICTLIGLTSGIIIAILDKSSKPLLGGAVGGAIAGVLAAYMCNVCINFFNAFITGLNANV
jgi:hypothetical protein